jgi:hypothetical protein
LEDDPSDAAGEILSDMRYYAWIETQYLWQFVLPVALAGRIRQAV